MKPHTLRTLAGAAALTLLASGAAASVTQTSGADTAATSYNHSADFELNTALSNTYSENGLSFVANGSARNNQCGYGGADCYDFPSDLSPAFSGNYLATAGNGSYISIKLSDGKDFQAIEFAVGSSYSTLNGYWVALNDGAVTGSGNFNHSVSVLGLSDATGIDEVRFYAFATAGKSSGLSAAAIDSVRVSAVPEPAAWGMMLAGLAALTSLARRRQRGSRKASV